MSLPSTRAAHPALHAARPVPTCVPLVPECPGPPPSAACSILALPAHRLFPLAAHHALAFPSSRSSNLNTPHVPSCVVPSCHSSCSATLRLLTFPLIPPCSPPSSRPTPAHPSLLPSRPSFLRPLLVPPRVPPVLPDFVHRPLSSAAGPSPALSTRCLSQIAARHAPSPVPARLQGDPCTRG